MTSAKLILDPPDESGGRLVRYDGVVLGTADRPSDVVELLRQAGVTAPEALDLGDPDVAEWRGAGPGSWAESPP
ncbi:hypothetical protein ACFVGY_11795 [Streptomyces sp. NPDC127106]|uniref:hypothetical protein n=1 Tax=Streptomyces sp. NPDC127106 TaxID=3345360 RepID=UPI0036345789